MMTVFFPHVLSGSSPQSFKVDEKLQYFAAYNKKVVF